MDGTGEVVRVNDFFKYLASARIVEIDLGGIERREMLSRRLYLERGRHLFHTATSGRRHIRLSSIVVSQSGLISTLKEGIFLVNSLGVLKIEK